MVRRSKPTPGSWSIAGRAGWCQQGVLRSAVCQIARTPRLSRRDFTGVWLRRRRLAPCCVLQVGLDWWVEVPPR